MMTHRTKIIGLLFKQGSILKKSKDTETISMARFTIYFKINIYKFAKKYLCLKNSTLFAYYLRNSFKTINYLIFFVNFWRIFFLTEKHFFPMRKFSLSEKLSWPMRKFSPIENFFSLWRTLFSLRNFFSHRETNGALVLKIIFLFLVLSSVSPSTVILPFTTIHASL